VYEISREWLNGFALNLYGRYVWFLAPTSLKVKVNIGGLRVVYVWKNIFALVKKIVFFAHCVLGVFRFSPLRVNSSEFWD